MQSAVLARGILSVCPSVRLSVTFRYCVQTNEDTIVRFSVSGRTIPLAWRGKGYSDIRRGSPPAGALKWGTPLSIAKIRARQMPCWSGREGGVSRSPPCDTVGKFMPKMENFGNFTNNKITFKRTWSLSNAVCFKYVKYLTTNTAKVGHVTPSRPPLT